MTVGTWSALISAMALVIAGLSYVGKVGGDQFWLSKDQLKPRVMEIGNAQWVTQDSYLKSELYKVQKEKRLLEWENGNGGLTPRQQFELQELKDLEEQYKLELQ